MQSLKTMAISGENINGGNGWRGGGENQPYQQWPGG
jgi:hypothetical protein